ncbi:hypothetical protein T492DRAFT_1088223, partial [Pavlovales sp. CCMP2436]
VSRPLNRTCEPAVASSSRGANRCAARSLRADHLRAHTISAELVSMRVPPPPPVLSWLCAACSAPRGPCRAGTLHLRAHTTQAHA